MKTLDYTGLKADKAEKVSKDLAQLLADFHVFYSNLRGFHWNIVGDKFFTLHEKFEEQYDLVSDQIDEVAERMLMLGATPENRQSEYLKVSKIKEIGHVADADKTVKSTLDGLKVLIAQERKIIESAGEIADEVTVDMMVEYLTEQEKTVWMLTAFLS